MYYKENVLNTRFVNTNLVCDQLTNTVKAFGYQLCTHTCLVPETNRWPS